MCSGYKNFPVRNLRHALKPAICAALLSLLMVPTATCAQVVTGDASIKHRKAAFTLINTYFSRIYAAVENERPYVKDEIAEAAQLVETLSALPWLGFAPGSEYGATRAKDDIWLDEERFQALAQDMQAKVKLLAVAARSGELRVIKPAFLAARETCQNCHKMFRKD